MELNLEKEIAKNIQVLTTLVSPSQSNLGILIAGEEYHQNSIQPIIRLYLIGEFNSTWRIQKELEAFAFSNYNSANQFISDLPEMSALDLLLLMNALEKKSLFLQ